jgi:adenylate kinase
MAALIASEERDGSMVGKSLDRTSSHIMDSETRAVGHPGKPAGPACAVILLGSPGAGKGTQSRRIGEILQIPQISSGDILRKNIRSGTELGTRVKRLVERGILTPDHLICEIVFQRLSRSDCENGFVLDGFPRTRVQAESFDSFLNVLGRQGVGPCMQTIVVHLTVSHSVILQRISGRRTCVTCDAVYNIHSQPPREPGLCDLDSSPLRMREDDREETILERLAIDREQAIALKQHYSRLGAVLEIDGDRPADKVTGEVQDVISSVMRTARIRS